MPVARNSSARALIVTSGLAGVALYAAGLSLQAARGSWNIFAALLIAPLFLLGGEALARGVAWSTGDRALARLVRWGACAKLAGCGARYVVIVSVYDSGDALRYFNVGSQYAQQLGDGYLSIPPGQQLVGTTFTEILTGMVVAVTRPTLLGSFLVFGLMGFAGTVLFIHAAHVGVPGVDLRRYALLVLLLPSLVFWPSSIGKDAFMLLGLGACALGAAHLFNHRLAGYGWLAGGLVATAMVRPHISLLACAGLTVALLLRRSRGQGVVLGPVGRAIGVAVIVAASAVVLRQAQARFGVEDQGLQGLSSTLTETTERTSQGGSAYEASPVRSVTDVPGAVIAVLFRPFPHEASNFQSLVASAEGTALLLLFIAARRRLLQFPRAVRRSPYVAFVTMYALLFALAFSSFGNFGILTRQRVQVFPFVLVLLALPSEFAAGPRDESFARVVASRRSVTACDA